MPSEPFTAEELEAIDAIARASGASALAIKGCMHDLRNGIRADVVANRLKSLGVTEEMLTVTAPAEPPRGVELHGTIVQPRAKWTCGGCKKRNDTRLQVPLARVERVVCARCHRMTKLSGLVAAPKEEEKCSARTFDGADVRMTVNGNEIPLVGSVTVEETRGQ